MAGAWGDCQTPVWEGQQSPSRPELTRGLATSRFKTFGDSHRFTEQVRVRKAELFRLATRESVVPGTQSRLSPGSPSTLTSQTPGLWLMHVLFVNHPDCDTLTAAPTG